MCQWRKGDDLDGMGEPGDDVDVLGVQIGSQAVVGGVCPLDDLIQGLVLEDGLHRPEDLLLGDLEVVLNIAEDCGFNKVALLATLFATCMSVLNQLASIWSS